MAIEHAGEIALAVCASLTESIIVDCLRPALDDVHAQARDVAQALHGYDLNAPHTLITAPARVRNAYGRLPELVSRRVVIYTARRRVNQIGSQTPEHDVTGTFAEFRDPLALHPNWKPGARVPRVPQPDDPTARLLWVVSPEAAPARPWLPTVAERDQRWVDTFAADIQMRNTARHNATAYGAVLAR